MWRPGVGLPKSQARAARWGVVAALLIAVIVVLVTLGGQQGIRGTAVSVVAPPVFVEGLNDQLARKGLSDQVFVASPDAAAAERQVAEGATAAALYVDLQGTTDRLHVDRARDPQFLEHLIETVRGAQAGIGRTTQARFSDFGPAPNTSLDNARILTWIATIAGFAVAAGLSVLIGPYESTAAQGARRLTTIAILSAAVALCATPIAEVAGWNHLAVAGGLWLSVFLVAALTLAVEALAGLLGLGLVAAAWIALAVPALTIADPLMLPRAAGIAWTWSPFGAVSHLLNAATVFGIGQVAWPLLLALAWLIGALLALGYARTMRPRGLFVVPHWRLHVLGLTSAVTVALIAATSAVPSPVVDKVKYTQVAASTLSHCHKRGPAGDVEDLNRVFAKKGEPHFQGGDVALNLLLQDDRRLWLFADTLQGPKNAMSMVPNSMMIRDGRCLFVVMPANRGPVIPNRLARPGANAVGYWPMSVLKVSRPGYDMVTVTAQRVQRTGEEPFDFVALGPAVAVFVVPAGGLPQLILVKDVGPDSADVSEPMWGAATAVEGKWVYLYGTANPGLPGVYGFSVRVARVTMDDIARRSAYTFWTGSGWSRDANQAVEVIPAAGGTSQTFSVFQQDGGWYALSKQNEFMGTNLMVWKAPSPTGPFVPSAPLAQIPSDPVEGTLVYMPLAHPDLLPEPGTMVVSYCRNDTDFEDVLEDPTCYRPYFMRVTLP